MLRTVLSAFALFICQSSFGQDVEPTNIRSSYESLHNAYMIDISKTTCLIPIISYEQFHLNKNESLQSWQVQAGYQFRYSDHFVLSVPAGLDDKFSIGVYQGLNAQGSYNYYSPHIRRIKPRLRYISIGLGLKYLWYNDIDIYDQMAYSASSYYSFAQHIYRTQSEKCIAAIPTITWGKKIINGHAVTDFYIGLQPSFRFRFKTISYEQTQKPDEPIVVNTDTPYEHYEFLFIPWLTIGIKVGHIH